MTEADAAVVTRYEGRPFEDSRYSAGAQVIPGEIRCAYYDLGGEGVAYHTEASANGGSGALNPANGSYLNEFRMVEPMGTTYTKPEIDDTEFNSVDPEIGMLYVGWTASGQWLNYSVEIEQPGQYEITVLYTAAVPAGSISLLIDGQVIGSVRRIPSMYDSRDPIDWRQVHHWAWTKPIVSSALTAGAHVLTLRLERAGHMNFAKIDFQLAGTRRAL